MILKEKVLCKRMNARYKDEGYEVVTFEHNSDFWIAISSGDAASLWFALCERSNVPRKVLSLIVEHAGDLPSLTGDAWWLAKDQEVQMMEYEGERDAVKRMLAYLDDAEPDRLLGTIVHLGGYRLWQNERTKKLWMMNPLLTGMADRNGRCTAAGDMMCIRGLVSAVLVSPRPADETEEKRLEHLAKVEWF